MVTRLAVLFLFVASVAHADDRLADMDPKVRVVAVPTAPVDELIDCLDDSNTRVREAAIAALAGKPEARAAVARRLARPRMSKRDFRALVQVGALREAGRYVHRYPELLAALDGKYDKALRALFGDPSWRVRRAVLRHTHVRTERMTGWRATLTAASAEDPAQAVRYAALALLVHARDAAALPVLRARLEDPDVRIVALALRGVGSLEPDAATTEAVTPALKAVNPLVRSLAAYALRHDRRYAELVAPLLRDEEKRVRATAVAVLAYMGVWRDDTADELLDAALRSGFSAPYEEAIEERPMRAGGRLATSYPRIDDLAFSAARKFGEKLAPLVVRRLPGEVDESGRTALVHALAYIGARRELKALLTGDDTHVKRCAALCLIGTGVREKLPLRIAVQALGSGRWGGHARATLRSITMPRAMLPFLQERLAGLEREHTTQGDDGTEMMEMTAEMEFLAHLIDRVK